jgi:proline iminopeptidase
MQNAAVAQWIEYWPPKPRVVGSIPASRTIIVDKLMGEPFKTGLLALDGDHQLFFEQSGNPQGLPVLFLHGGPGVGCIPLHRSLFDAARCNIIMFDQRGCGRSTPVGQLQNNTSADLVADIEKLRRHLGIEKWLVTGGSWGAGLALAYAAAHPDPCLGLVLRGVFLGRQSDADWFFQDARQLMPDAWAFLTANVPTAKQNNLLEWFGQGLRSADEQVRQDCVRAWSGWENALSQAHFAPPSPRSLSASEAVNLVNKYLLQSHYLQNQCFWSDPPLLARLQSLASMPTAILHGRRDWICRPSAAWDLHQVLPKSRLIWLDQCGHTAFDPVMTKALISATSHFIEHRDFASFTLPPP